MRQLRKWTGTRPPTDFCQTALLKSVTFRRNRTNGNGWDGASSTRISELSWNTGVPPVAVVSMSRNVMMPTWPSDLAEQAARQRPSPPISICARTWPEWASIRSKALAPPSWILADSVVVPFDSVTSSAVCGTCTSAAALADRPRTRADTNQQFELRLIGRSTPARCSCRNGPQSPRRSGRPPCGGRDRASWPWLCRSRWAACPPSAHGTPHSPCARWGARS